MDGEWLFDDDTLMYWGERFRELRGDVTCTEGELPPGEQHSDDWVTGRAALQLAYELLVLVLGDAVSIEPVEIDPPETPEDPS